VLSVVDVQPTYFLPKAALTYDDDFDPTCLLLPTKHFLDLVAVNPDLQLERTSDGELVICLRRGGETGERNDEISQLRAWNKQANLGKPLMLLLVLVCPTTSLMHLG